jgi:hypothetical protein
MIAHPNGGTHPIAGTAITETMNGAICGMTIRYVEARRRRGRR